MGARSSVDDDVAGQRRRRSVVETTRHHAAPAERLDFIGCRTIRIHDRSGIFWVLMTAARSALEAVARGRGQIPRLRAAR